MGTLNIIAYFKEAKQKHQEQAAIARAEANRLREEISRKEETKTRLEEDRSKKNTTLREVEAEGVDGSKLEEKIREIDREITDIAKAIDGLKEALRKAVEFDASKFEKEERMASVLKSTYACEEAEIVDQLGGVYDLLPLSITLDQDGRPVSAVLSLDASQRLRIPIKPSEEHFFPDFIHSDLHWIPKESFPRVDSRERFDPVQSTVHPTIRAFFDRSSSRILLSRSNLKWQVNTRWAELKAFEEDFRSDSTFCLLRDAEDLCLSAGGELSLLERYTQNPLFASVQARIVAKTTSAPAFKKRTQHLDSDEVSRLIKADWDALRDCPWSQEIRGTFALLKYHIENGEKVRFWSGDFDGVYGYRLRTRDHDWIVGRFFIDSKSELATSKTRATAVYPSYDQDTWPFSANLGRLSIVGHRDRSERKRF